MGRATGILIAQAPQLGAALRVIFKCVESSPVQLRWLHILQMQETSDRNALEAELRALKKERIEAEAEQTQKLVDLRAKLASAETATALAERSAQEAEKRARDVLEMHTTSQADAESRFDPHLTGTAQLFMYGTVRHS